MVDIRSVYKYTVKIGAILVTCIFIGMFVNFAFKNILLGKDAYNWDGGYSCDMRYSDTYNQPVPAVKPLSTSATLNRAEWVKACEENDAKQKAFNYKKGLFDDISWIVSMCLVSAFLWIMDRKNGGL